MIVGKYNSFSHHPMYGSIANRSQELFHFSWAISKLRDLKSQFVIRLDNKDILVFSEFCYKSFCQETNNAWHCRSVQLQSSSSRWSARFFCKEVLWSWVTKTRVWIPRSMFSFCPALYLDGTVSRPKCPFVFPRLVCGVREAPWQVASLGQGHIYPRSWRSRCELLLWLLVVGQPSSSRNRRGDPQQRDVRQPNLKLGGRGGNFSPAGF